MGIRHHAEVGSAHAPLVPDEIGERYCIVGPLEAHLLRLQELQEAGVTQCYMYLMRGDEEASLDVDGHDVMPIFGRG